MRFVHDATSIVHLRTPRREKSQAAKRPRDSTCRSAYAIRTGSNRKGVAEAVMASLEIVTIGTELLLGHLVDTNSAFVASALADVGVDVYAKHSVGDNPERLEAMLRGALERADGVITTGGLGPTVDDLTKDAVAAATGTHLELHE